MPDTRRDIAQFGKGEDYWYYDCWGGFIRQPIDDWYYAEGTGPGERGISCAHRATPEEALADMERVKVEDEADGRTPYDSWRIVKVSPSLKISIEREVN